MDIILKITCKGKYYDGTPKRVEAELEFNDIDTAYTIQKVINKCSNVSETSLIVKADEADD